MPTTATTEKVRKALKGLPWQTLANGTTWRSALVDGNWWAESQSSYYVCVVANSFVTQTIDQGLYGLGQTTTELPAFQRAGTTREIAIPPYMPGGMKRGVRTRGFGMEYTDKPKPGDYHVNGNGVVLRALPQYSSKAIATLQNGEGVYVFGDVETDPEYKILQDDSVVKNDGEIAGIDYVRIGTQTHGAGWIAMPYIEPGAGGAATQQPKPAPSPTPAPTPSSSSGMSVVQKILLGGAIGATVAGGAYLVVRAVQQSQSRRPAYA